jgi:ABC-type Na+ efflux pump permease subunit
MTELFLLIVTTLIIMITVGVRLKRKTLNHLWADLNTHVFLLLAGWVILSILVGLFIVFDDIERSKDYSNLGLLHGSKVCMHLMMWGLLVLSVIISGLLHLKSKNQD